MNHVQAQILLVEHRESLARSLSEALTSAGHAVRVSCTDVGGLDVLKKLSVDVVVADAHLPSCDNMGFLQHLVARPVATPVILLAERDPDLLVRACNLGASQVVLTQPAAQVTERLCAAVQEVWPRRQSVLERGLSAENRDLLSKLQLQQRNLMQLAHRMALVEQQEHRRSSLERLREDFIRLLSHEMRTPLTSILGFSEIVREGLINDPEEVKEMVEHIHGSGSRLSHFVDDALELFAWYSSAKELSLQRFPVKHWVGLAVQRVEAYARERDVSIELALPSSPGFLEADPTAIEEALYRVLNNAVKFSRAGGTVTVSATSNPEGVSLSVLDRGIGFDPGLADTLFRPLDVCGDLQYHTEGKGLSLPLVQAILEGHGGRIQLRSEGVGLGAVVTLYTPYRVPESLRERASRASRRRKPHVLLAQLD